MKHEILPIMAVVVCELSFFVLPAQAKYGGGTGERNDPYLIYNANQMNAIGADSNDWDKHFKLMADIDLAGFSGTAFNIIGDDERPFTGVFDGNGKKIFNFTYTSTDTARIGLFAYVSGGSAEIKDLGLIYTNVDAGTVDYVGSLVGWLRGGTITGCYIEGGSVSGMTNVAGLVGWNSGTITNCYSEAVVSGTMNVGGLVGVNGWFGAGTITNCYSTGSVSGNDRVGGLVGWNYYATITNCYAAGSVTGTTNVGGLVGSNDGDVWDSFWDIETSGQTSSGGGTGLPTVEMQMQITFTDADWDFVTPVWTIDEGVDYPRLRWENNIPVADAGPDQTVYAWIDGIAEVTLDGTGSYDDDGQPLTYLWSWTIDGQIYDVNGVTPVIELPAGEQTIELIVNDGIDDSEPDEVVITVVPPMQSQLWIAPRVINRHSRQPKILALVRLPEGVTGDQIDSDERLLLYPGGIEAMSQRVTESRRQGASIFALFDKAELMDAVSANGSVELQVVGQFKTGQYFCGTDTVLVIGNW